MPTTSLAKLYQMTSDQLMELLVQTSLGCATFTDWRNSPLLEDIAFILDVKRATETPIIKVDSSSFETISRDLNQRKYDLTISYDEAFRAHKKSQRKDKLPIALANMLWIGAYALGVYGSIALPTQGVIVVPLTFLGMALGLAHLVVPDKSDSNKKLVETEANAYNRNQKKIDFLENKVKQLAPPSNRVQSKETTPTRMALPTLQGVKLALR